MAFPIDPFWKERLLAADRGRSGVITGWEHCPTGLATFTEAPLSLAEGFGSVSPDESKILLVSAPGAVGKSTLARQLAFETGAMLVDLARTDPVGANTIIGGLARAELYQGFLNGTASLVIDGLDEARIRVTQEGFVAFLKDVADLAADDIRPIVLFGRTGAIQEAWIALSDFGVKAPVLEIEYYNADQALEFSLKQTQAIRGEDTPREPDKRALKLLLERLSSETEADKNKFSGYSPVLVAIAKQVADPTESSTNNTQQLISRIERGEENITLKSICDSILQREQGKLESLQFKDSNLMNILYSANEQVQRLIHRLFGAADIPRLPEMSNEDRSIYEQALDTWVQEHPFLDGDGRNPSSAVFGGFLAATALRTEMSSRVALERELGLGSAINPFLAEFYFDLLPKTANEHARIPASHVGAVYASVRARLAVGETASLRIEAGESDDDEAEGVETEIEITRTDRSENPIEAHTFITPKDDKIVFGSLVEDIDVYAPNGNIYIGYGEEAIFTAPVYIETRNLEIDVRRISAESLLMPGTATQNGKVIHIRAGEEVISQVVNRPICRGEVTLELCWPGSTVHPWTEYSVEAPEPENPRIDEALRRLKKMLRLFRSHSRNQLAKYRQAIDHRRRTKGTGQAVLDHLKREGVITINGPMYYLDADLLSERVGLSFQDVRTTRYSGKTLEFLEAALNWSG